MFRPPWRLALSLFFAAVLVRVVLWAALGTPHPISGEDQQEFLHIRDLILSTGQFLDPDTGRPLARRDPGYPAFLALLKLMGFGSLNALWLVQCVISTATGLFLCAALWNAVGPRAARVVSFLFLLQLSFASYTFIAYSETLACCALAAMLAAVVAWHGWHRALPSLAAGGLAAAAILTRCTALLGIGGVLSVAVRSAHAGTTPPAFRPSPARRRGIWIAAGALLLPLTLWSARNQVRVGLPFLNTTGVFQLSMGNSSMAPMAHSHRASDAAWDSLADRPEVERASVALRRLGASLSEDPARIGRRAAMRVLDALEGDRMLIGLARRGQFPERPHAVVLVVGVLVLLVSIVPCVLGLAVVFNPGPHWLSVAGRWAFLGILATQVLTVAHARYTMPAWILLLPGGSLMVERLRNGERRARWSVALAAMVSALLLVRQVVVE